MSQPKVNIDAAKSCLSDSLRLIREGKNEQAVRDSFTSHLRQIFPELPNWVEHHIHGSEAALKISRNGRNSTGFVDNLVDLTAIEYEGDLRITAKYNSGLSQVKDYCAGLINKGHDPELVIGILSDTVRWYAYLIDLTHLPEGTWTSENIALKEVEFLDCSVVSDKTAWDLVRFLIKYLGREGARPVSAYSIAKDLGFDSRFCHNHLVSLSRIIQHAFESNPKYASLISDLWCAFVSYLREEGRSEKFDLKTYVDEYYILTLGKLICANYLEQTALSSTDAELTDIANGKFFENRGLMNFIEYDYFGWLNSDPHISSILPIAKAMQQDLVAYDFTSRATEDLFGQLMAQLANRSQRLLLGQEWTPGWLSQKLVSHVITKIPPDEPLRLIDMCCGSGSIIVEAIEIAKTRIQASSKKLSKEKQIDFLIQAISGFDIDPLAVMLSKVNWVLAAKDWIQPFGSFQISIPIYHADSLFAITPISIITDSKDGNEYILRVAEYAIFLPGYLISPEFRALFDALSETCYQMVDAARDKAKFAFTRQDITLQVEAISAAIGAELNEQQFEDVCIFLTELVSKIDALSRDGRNGIWAYILRNSFRPGLVLGQFNGLVSNPPWLALSKVADNPYQAILKRMAEEFNIKPPGSSHLHIELATIFLLHAIEHYLVDGAVVGCIVPDTVLNGHHHNPFRKNQFFTSGRRVPFDITEIWKVGGHVFKNNAAILFGLKKHPVRRLTKPIPGKIVFEDRGDSDTIFHRNTQGERTAWSEQELTEDDAGFYIPANFRQGADIMPRNLLFYEISPAGSGFFNTMSINPASSPIAYIVKDAKKHRDFSLKPRLLPKSLFFDVITSNLLTPFDIAKLQKALIPIKKDIDGIWKPLSDGEMIAKGPAARNTFDEICKTANPIDPSVNSLFALIDVRGKLTQQVIPPNGYIIMTGAGGGKVCSGYIDIQDCDPDRLILDQTVYWTQVYEEDEAIYLTGLLNSDAISSIIREFQPRGAFGERHVHKLPFGVTPPYDPEQAAHQDVVETTKELISEYEYLKLREQRVIELLDPNYASLAVRRRQLLKYIKGLPAYGEYEEACKSLYGL
jgi:hypothetical protein